jgi:outer membrane protein assembly factor BamB
MRWVAAFLAFTAAGALAHQAPADTAWRQWGGPNRNFIVETTGLADAWPEGGPRVIWKRPLGPGHSSILAEDGRLYTMYRKGNGRAKVGPFDAAESVVALDAATGKTIWEHTYPSKIEDFTYGAGPHSTPLLIGDRLFSIGTNKQLFALDKRTGKVIWSHDLVSEFGSPTLLIRPVVKAGYGCSPIAYRDTIICSVGGPGQSVMAFRQSDGGVVWKSGDFLTSEVAPIIINVAGRDQLVIVGGGTVNGLNPATGDILWSHPHDPGNDLNCSTPLWAPDNLLFLSSAYKSGSHAIRLTPDGTRTLTDDVWFTTRVRYMFLSAIRLGDFVYGTSGDLGPSFLTALDLRTGQMAWQHRGIGRASLVYADGKAIMLEEDGDLALARLTPEGVTVLAQAKLFDTMSWTAPTLAGRTLYARDRENIVALDLSTPGTPGTPGTSGSRNELSPANSPSVAPVQPRPLSGTWKLDQSRSKIGLAAAPAGLVKSAAPETVHITHAANGTVIVESQINESQSRIYRPGVKTTSAVVPNGTIAMTSKWDGATLVADGTLEGPGGSTAVKETFAVGADGALTLTVTMSTSAEPSVSTLVYARTSSVGSCKSWPAPCKDFK